MLVAFVILSLVGTALFRLFSGALGNASAADDYSRAVLVAESVLAEAASAVPLGEATNADRPTTAASRGRRASRRIRRPACRRTSSARRDAMPTRLCRVTAEVTFAAPSGGNRTFALATTRIGPKGRAMKAMPVRARGFTLVELTVALVLMAGIAALLYGSLSLAARTWDGGEAKTLQVSDMRTAQRICARRSPRNFRCGFGRSPGFRCCSVASATRFDYAAALPTRVAEGGVYLFRLAVVRNGDKSQLVQERMIPDVNALEPPEFRDAERSVLAEGIAELRIEYFGRDVDAADADAPTWRDRWDDKQRLPLLVRIDVKPEKGAAWPTLVVEPRRSPEAGCPAWNAAAGRCSRPG